MFRRRRPLHPPAAPVDNSSDSEASDGDVLPDEDLYKPTPIDIAVVRAMLSQAKKLPPDLVDSIFDFAEYWAHSAVELHESIRLSGTAPSEDTLLLRSYPLGLVNLGGEETVIPTNSKAYSTNPLRPLPRGKEYDPAFFAKLAKYPTPKLVSPARKVVFSMKSQDQGWASSSDTTSWTWFEAGLEKFDAEHVCNDSCSDEARNSHPGTHDPPLSLCSLRPLQPEIKRNDNAQGEYKYDFPIEHHSQWEIKRNKRTEDRWRTHVITWSYLDNVNAESEEGQRLEEQGRGRDTGDGSFVRGLKFGDVVTLWGKARFPGWTNRVSSARIDVYWAV
ncbi:hypothetical protein PT974_12555 [Cladobotryum mycophilum]|uniref:Uncharacterized protein n=1 Tax=Cladobotryum mycophilum TaxID=491253 RepID=A0ABR0S9R8_9HYPO